MPVTTSKTSQAFPVERVAALSVKSPEEQWLVKSIWSRGAVGFLFGPPKCSKSWMGLDLATSVASGTPCLGVFPVQDPGPALVYLAEDALEHVRARVASLCDRRGLDIHELPLHVITAPTLRLDLEPDQEKLRRTVEKIRPRLLVLDPLVRMHAVNENDSAEISRLLGFLRKLQRTYDLAIVVVHHARKRGALQAGQTLRGSSDLYAWTDSSLCLTRQGERRLLLRVEHRSARSPDSILLELHSMKGGTSTSLRVLNAQAPPPSQGPSSIARTILEILEKHRSPRTNRELRDELKVQNGRLGRALADLKKQGLVQRKGRAGWVLTPKPESDDQSQLPFS